MDKQTLEAVTQYLHKLGMRVLIDLTGKKFGRLTVLKRVKKQPKRTHWLCRCKCGKDVVVAASNLKSGATKSCGCLQGERTAKANSLRTTHGHTRHKKSELAKPSPTYRSWKSMLDRCYQPSMGNYHQYGGRGITVCRRWRGPNGFTNFLADMGERPLGMTLDRYPNKNGNYTPGNCRWATPKQQAANRHYTPEGLAARSAALDKGRRSPARRKR